MVSKANIKTNTQIKKGHMPIFSNSKTRCYNYNTGGTAS